MKVIAHRGDSGKYPENTMLAFHKAVEAGCDEIELDIQCTKDGVVVVIHDETLERVTDGAGRVVDHTFAELQRLNAATAWGGRHGFCGIPSFEEYCQWAAGQEITTNVEIKTGKYYYEDIEERAVGILRHYGLEKRAMFSSFNHVSLIRAKELAPEIPCGILVTEAGIGNAGYYCRKYGFEYYHPGFQGLTKEIVEECRALGVELNVWTINGMGDLEQMADLGIRGAITDYPNVCKVWLTGR